MASLPVSTRVSPCLNSHHTHTHTTHTMASAAGSGSINHVFNTNDWDDLYSSCFLFALGTAVSDHCPLLLDLHADFHMGRRFKFESFWPRAEGFMETVATAWNSISSVGNPFVVLDRKFRATAK